MDKYQTLREAAVAATTGPWERHDAGGFVVCVRQVVSGRGICSTFVQNQPKTPAGWENQRHQNNANSEYIAAANPATIQALLAERDALRAVAEEVIARLENYERHGEVCPFEGEPMIYAATLIELGEQARAALSQ